jgi:hypothetical protein
VIGCITPTTYNIIYLLIVLYIIDKYISISDAFLQATRGMRLAQPSIKLEPSS